MHLDSPFVFIVLTSSLLTSPLLYSGTLARTVDNGGPTQAVDIVGSASSNSVPGESNTSSAVTDPHDNSAIRESETENEVEAVSKRLCSLVCLVSGVVRLVFACFACRSLGMSSTHVYAVSS